MPSLVVHKSSSQGKNSDQETTRYDLRRREPGQAEGLAEAIRGHWGGIEIRNHWVREALWLEDRTRSKHGNLHAVLAVLRAGDREPGLDLFNRGGAKHAEP